MATRQLLGTIGALALACACGGGVSEADGESSLCDAGETQECVGPGQCEGAQVCKSSGQAWGPCDCGSVGTGGEATSSGGQGGTGTNSGGTGADETGGTGGKASGGTGGKAAGGTGGQTAGGGTGSGGQAAGGTGASAGGTGGSSGGTGGSTGGTGPQPSCGDGELASDEACDDGGHEAGDGCSADCSSVGEGYSCAVPGKACENIARCGDGVVSGAEACDDDNTLPGDGCSASCTLELGSKCVGSPSFCTNTTCGDLAVEGAEGCDDGNRVPNDGCSPQCQNEPHCDASGCLSECGDGIVAGAEQCDDGNRLDGDGCSSTCKPEAGYSCEPEAACDASDPSCVLAVPAIFRDFDATNPDFAVSCGNYVKGVVQDALDENGKPVLKSGTKACIASGDSFKAWYSGAGTTGTVNLFPNEHGAFVNRLTNDGQQFTREISQGLQWCSDAPNGCDECPAGYTTCYAPCTPWSSGNTQTCAEYPSGTLALDGNPLFFPLPVSGGATGEVAEIPLEVYGGGWSWDPSGEPRNFRFTSELTYWFKYEAGSSAELHFAGDDDVWVFLNNQLALDLGGLHVPIEAVLSIEPGGVTLSTPNVNFTQSLVSTTRSLASFGLANGGIYEIKVFHAERKSTASTFKLALSGFHPPRSECTPVCGDGILGVGEECDDGDNDGGYGLCQPGCVLGAYCGDGVIQAPEDCDDGNRNDDDDCNNSCRQLFVK